MRFINGVAAGAMTLTTLAAGMASVNFLARSWAGRRIAEQGSHLTAEAVLTLF